MAGMNTKMERNATMTESEIRDFVDEYVYEHLKVEAWAKLKVRFQEPKGADNA